ncbi:MAG: cell cycle transcriptional regulator TrcR [Pseudomonadota bacterium]
MALPLMRKATAVWLVDNTTLSFKQISAFTGLHELEVNGIADGEVAQGVKGFDPIANNQLEQAEIDKAQADPAYRMKLKYNAAAEGETKRKGPRYTPLSKRQDRPSAIAWLVKFHPELADSQISKLVGTTKPTILTIRERTHWNIANIQPVDPVALGLTTQVELDAAIAKAAAKAAKAGQELPKGADPTLMSVDDSLSAEAKVPSNMAGLENFTFGAGDEAKDDEEPGAGIQDADALFNLPASSNDEDDEKA